MCEIFLDEVLQSLQINEKLLISTIPTGDYHWGFLRVH